MHCPDCKADAPGGACYCPACGIPLGQTTLANCRQCQSVLFEADLFCRHCGVRVSPATPLPADESGTGGFPVQLLRLMPRQYVEQILASEGATPGERRVITILFSDVKGSTALAEVLDPEEVMEIMNGAFEALLAPVQRYGGTPARIMGDAILCFFGAPTAHEDDPIRACRCALDILDAVSNYSSRLESAKGIQGFNVRVGINSGLVVVGEVGGSSRFEYTAMGDAVNLAARMESMAAPGTILMTEATHRLVESDFDTAPMGRLEIRGKRTPVTTYQLLSLKAKSGASRIRATPRARFFGRDDEKHCLSEWMSQFEKGNRVAGAVVGDAGIGKSRLLDEVRRAAPSRLEWIEGRCVPFDSELGFSLVRSVLLQSLRAPDGMPGHEFGTMLRERLQEWSRVAESGTHSTRRTTVVFDASETYGLLAHLLGLPLDTQTSKRLDNQPPDVLWQQLIHACHVALRMRTGGRPTVLVLEDLQWIDASSSRLFQGLLPALPESSILPLLVMRREQGRLWSSHVHWRDGGFEHYRVLELSPLSKSASSALLRDLFIGHTLSPTAETLLLSRAEGNAFYLEELSRSLVASGHPSQASASLGARSDSPVLEIPHTLRGVIMSRIDQLDPPDKRVLQTAAVLGRTFRMQTLSPMLSALESSCDVSASLNRLVALGFLSPQADSSVSATRSAPTSYVFRHAMTQEVAYESLLRTQRKSLHLRAGTSLEEILPEDAEDRSTLLAHHFERGDCPKAAYPYLVTCARRASSFWVLEEALGYYQRALGAISAAKGAPVDDTPGWYPAPSTVHMEFGDLLYRQAQYTPALEQYDQAAGYVVGPLRQVQLWRKRGQVCEKRGQYDQAKEYFERALSVARKEAVASEVPHVYTGLSLVYYHLGRLDQAIQIGSMALQAIIDEQDPWGEAKICSTLGLYWSERGDWEEAERLHRRALETWSALDDVYGLATAHNNLGIVALHASEHQAARRHFEQAQAYFEQINNPHGLARVYDNLSQLCLALGEEQETRRYLELAVTLLAELSVEDSEIHSGMWKSGAL